MNNASNLSQKETALLGDLMAQEELCVEKYKKYAADAQDTALKSIFTSLASVEQEHYNTLRQIASGNTPPLPAEQAQSKQAGQSTPQQLHPKTATNTSTTTTADPGDKYLCQDVLTSEKHVSAVYDTSIFEFRDNQIRQLLGHIQKEEQDHGKQIYDYMSSHQMYQVQ